MVPARAVFRLCAGGTLAGTSSTTVEVVVATGVPDTRESWALCDDRNQRTPLGRWVLDPLTGVLGVRADLPMRHAWARACLDAVVAEVLLSAEPTASAPRGRPDRSDQVCREVLPLVQDDLLWDLPGWYVEHDTDGSSCIADDGSLLRVQSERHPVTGWGVGVRMGGEAYGADIEIALPLVIALNRAEADRADVTPALGRWAYGGGGVEYCVFCSTALLSAAGDLRARATLVRDLAVAAAARADADLPNRAPPASARPALMQSHRPTDHDVPVLHEPRRSEI